MTVPPSATAAPASARHPQDAPAEPGAAGGLRFAGFGGWKLGHPTASATRDASSIVAGVKMMLGIGDPKQDYRDKKATVELH